MEDITVVDAKEHLEELIERARRGEDVRILDASGVAVKLVPADLVPADRATAGRAGVVLGTWKHLDEIPAERLLAPLSKEELSWLSGEMSAGT